MTYEDHIRAIADRLTEKPPVYWGSLSEQNVEADKIEEENSFPAILLYPPILEGEFDQFGRSDSRYTAVMSFIQRADMDDVQNTNGYAIVASMRDLAQRFAYEAREYLLALGTQQSVVVRYMIHAVDPTKKLDAEAFFDFLDINCAGVGLSLSLPVLEQVKSC